MWTGGVRVIILDENGRILMVKQSHEGKDFWLVPGGGIEQGETSKEAAAREVMEETGLRIKVDRLLWHVEEVSEEKGMRFVNFFLADMIGGDLELGMDPEFDGEHQVLREVAFLTKEEIQALEKVYPEVMKDEFWDIIEKKNIIGTVYREKPCKGFGL